MKLYFNVLLSVQKINNLKIKQVENISNKILDKKQIKKCHIHTDCTNKNNFTKWIYQGGLGKNKHTLKTLQFLNLVF